MKTSTMSVLFGMISAVFLITLFVTMFTGLIEATEDADINFVRAEMGVMALIYGISSYHWKGKKGWTKRVYWCVCCVWFGVCVVMLCRQSSAYHGACWPLELMFIIINIIVPSCIGFHMNSRNKIVRGIVSDSNQS